jgi:hypothetical protein
MDIASGHWHIIPRSMKEEQTMKCPNCRYVSHDYLDSCRKCSTDLVAFKRNFNLIVLRPGDLDLGLLVGMSRENVLDRDRFHRTAATSDTPPGKSYIGLDELTEETAIDIQFDSDTPSTSTEPGELTKTFYVPEVLARQVSEMHLSDRAAGLDEPPAPPEIALPFDLDPLAPLAAQETDGSTVAPDAPVPPADPESDASYVQPHPVDTTDISVGQLDDCLNEFEDIHLDTAEIDHDLNLLSLPATAEIEEIPPDLSSTSVADETPEPMLFMAQEEPPASAGLLDDNLADNEPGLQLEETSDMPSEERNADTEQAE